MARIFGQPRTMMICSLSLVLASCVCGVTLAAGGGAGSSSAPVTVVQNLPIAKGAGGSAPASALPLSPELNAGFPGIEDSQRFGPASAQIAAGPTHVVQAINSLFQISDKTGVAVAPVDPRVLFDAFYVANPSYTIYPERSAPLGPTAIYDHFSSRFVIVWGAVNDSGSESSLLIQVSLTSNPTQGWRLFTLRSDVDGIAGTITDTDALSDSLAVGFDNTNLYFTTNQLSPSGAFRFAKIRVAAKHQFYNPTANPIRFHDLVNVLDANAVLASSIRPCVTFGVPGREFLVSAPVAAGDNLTLYSVTGTWPNATRTPPLLKVEAKVPFNAWTAPSKMIQPASAVLLDGGDGRLLNAVYRNGVVYTGHSIRAKGFTCAAGIKSIDVATKTKVLDEVLGATGEFYSFPAVTADAVNNVYTVFNRSSKGAFAECRYALKKSTETTFEISKQLKGGTSKSIQFGGAWGKSNGIALDPTLNGGVWVSSMFAQTTPSLSFTFGTWVGNFGQQGPVPVGPQVVATYDDLAKTLTLTGDASANEIAVSYASGVVTIVAQPGTQVNGQPAVAFAVSTGPIIVMADLGAGHDVVTFTGINSSTMNVILGLGDDQITIRLSTVSTVFVDGGLGADILLTPSSRFTKKTFLSFP